MHFLYGIWFLVLCTVVMAGYLIIPCLLLPVIQRIVALFNGSSSETKNLPFFWFAYRERRKLVLRTVLMIALFFFSIYGQQRLTWMGEDNANYTAKEYFVAGQPLSGVRWVLCEFINPENPVLVPLNSLQRMIYNRGVQYLPEQDGERGVWDDLWFYYPYIRRMHKPYGTNDFEPSYGMRHLLDQMYASLTIMSTQPFADKQMEQEQAYLHLPRIVLYILWNNGHYADKSFGSRKPLSQQREYVQQIENLYQWIVEIRQKWIAAGLYHDIKIDHPKLEVTRQMLAIHLCGDLIYADIFTGDFSCDHPLIPEYLSARREFTDASAANYVWGQLHRQQPQTAEDLYSMTIDSYSVSFNKYILEQYCDYEVLGVERYYEKRDKKFSEKQRIPTLKRIFHQEIELIEEGNNGR